MSLGPDWTSSQSYADAQKSSFDAWALCLRRKWLILFMVALAVGLGYLYYTKATPIYQTEAQVLVVGSFREQELPIKLLGGKVDYEDSLSTHMLLITSPMIVARAVKDHNLTKLASLKEKKTPLEVVGTILEDLEAMRAGGKEAPDANVMLLTYRNPDPSDVTMVIKAVIGSYQDFLGETYQNINDETVQLISQAKDVLYTQLTEKEAEYRKFRLDSPLYFSDEEQPSIPEMRMHEIEKMRTGLALTRAQTKARLAAIEKALSDGSNRQSLILMVGKWNEAQQKTANTQMFAALESQLFPLLLEEQMLLAEYGHAHPAVKAVQRKIQVTTQYIENRRLDITSEDESMGARSDFLTTYIESLQHELEDTDEQDRELGSLFEQELAAAKLLRSFQVKDETYRTDIERTDQLFQSVLKRFEEINLVKDQVGLRTQTIASPDSYFQAEPNIFKVMGVAVFAGILSGFGLGYLVDIADKSFRSPEEVRHELGAPILGHIPVLDLIREKAKAPDAQSESPVKRDVCTFHRPKSTMSEAYRSVRTALNFGTRGEGHKVVQVTSPDPGDGKTTLVTNLGVCFAQAGQRVLLVDADFRRPKIHKSFGVNPQIGLCQVLKGTEELADAVIPTAMENLFILPCGAKPPNPSELLSQPRFAEMLELLRDQYDIVLVDTPPVLAVTDPCVVAPRVDGIVMLIRITKNVRPHARRAMETLESLGANLLGVVVNGVGGVRPGMGYGFGQQYGYRYASSSGYYDGYTYGERRYLHYYTDDERERVSGNGNGARPTDDADVKVAEEQDFTSREEP